MAEEQDLVNLAIQYVETADLVEEVYMTEIQLRRIVDRTAKEQQSQQSDGDETMTKNGKTISIFSKEAMNIGTAAYYLFTGPDWLLVREGTSFQETRDPVLLVSGKVGAHTRDNEIDR